MKNLTVYYDIPKQGILPAFFSECLDITDPVFTFDRFMEEVDLRKYLNKLPAHVIESDYPGDAVYAWVVGAETAYIVGNMISLGGRGLGLSPCAAMIGGGLFGGLADNKFQESVENKLKE